MDIVANYGCVYAVFASNGNIWFNVVSDFVLLNKGTGSLDDKDSLSEILLNDIFENMGVSTILDQNATLFIQTYLRISWNQTMVDGSHHSDSSLLILSYGIDLDLSSAIK